MLTHPQKPLELAINAQDNSHALLRYLCLEPKTVSRLTRFQSALTEKPFNPERHKGICLRQLVTPRGQGYCNRVVHSRYCWNVTGY